MSATLLKVTLGDGPASVSRITVRRPHRVVVVRFGKARRLPATTPGGPANLELVRAVLEGVVSGPGMAACAAGAGVRAELLSP